MLCCEIDRSKQTSLWSWSRNVCTTPLDSPHFPILPFQPLPHSNHNVVDFTIPRRFHFFLEGFTRFTSTVTFGEEAVVDVEEYEGWIEGTS